MYTKIYKNGKMMAKKDNVGYIQFRVSSDTWELLVKEADIRGLSINLAARDAMLEGLFKYDSKQEYLVSRLDQQDEDLGKLLKLIALSVATSSLPLEQSGYDREKLRELIRTHLVDSTALSKSVLDMLDKGKI